LYDYCVHPVTWGLMARSELAEHTAKISRNIYEFYVELKDELYS